MISVLFFTQKSPIFILTQFCLEILYCCQTNTISKILFIREERILLTLYGIMVRMAESPRLVGRSGEGDKRFVTFEAIFAF